MFTIFLKLTDIKQADGILTFEECFIELKAKLIELRANSTFYGHEILEYLSPGWLQRQIDKCRIDNPPNNDLIRSLENLEEIRRKKVMKDDEMHKNRLSERLLRGLTEWRMDSALKQQPADFRAVVVCKS